MATLNIKNLPDRLYKKLQARAKEDRRSVAQEVTHLLDVALDAAEPLSILELRGLSKEHWRDLDAGSTSNASGPHGIDDGSWHGTSGHRHGDLHLLH